MGNRGDKKCVRVRVFGLGLAGKPLRNWNLPENCPTKGQGSQGFYPLSVEGHSWAVNSLALGACLPL